LIVAIYLLSYNFRTGPFIKTNKKGRKTICSNNTNLNKSAHLQFRNLNL